MRHHRFFSTQPYLASQPYLAFSRAVRMVTNAGACFSAIMVVYMVVHIIVEITARYFFSTSTFVLDEFVGYALAGVIFPSLGYAMESGSMIRVNLFLPHFPPAVRRFLEFVGVLCTFLIMLVAAWVFWLSVVRNWSRGARSETMAAVPLWIPESIAALGISIFCLQLFAYLLRIMLGGALVDEGRKSEFS